jgi:hypothetical protein
MSGGHDHGHGHEEQAYFLGIKPGSPWEGFEVIYGLTILSCTLVVVGGSFMKTDVDFQTWARREAEAREKIIEKGGEIEYGKYYQTVKYKDEGMSATPSVDED